MSAAKTLLATLLCACAAAALAVAPAQAAFGLKDVEIEIHDEDGTPSVQAGSHPFAITTRLAVETEIDPDSGKVVPSEEARDVNISFPPGIVGNPTAVPQCGAQEFLAGKSGECPNASGVGFAEIEFGEPGKITLAPIFNLLPAPGAVAKLGFIVEDRAPVTIDIGLNPEAPNNVVVRSTRISQALFFLRAKIIVWGVPTADAHNGERGSCALDNLLCDVSLPEKPFLTLPASCVNPLTFNFEADSWQNPDPPQWFETNASVGGNATPLKPSGCDKLDFAPEISAQPTSLASSSASGLNFNLDFDDEGLVSGTGNSQATVRKAVVTLPEGMTLNPSAADGLASCSEAQLASETASSAPGQGCPQASKVGDVEVETPLLEGRLLKGALYVATQDANPYKSLIALYMVIKDPDLGLLVKLPGKVTPDPATGQLITTFGEPPFAIPQLPFSHFRFHFRPGGRAPLITPPLCGKHVVTAVFTPSSGAAPLEKTTSFQTVSGVNGGPCPAGGVKPFSPGFEAGSLNSAAGRYSPFYMRLTRQDGEQDLTRFSSILPPGVTGKIAGLAQCSQAALGAAKAKTGRQEMGSPSCPSSSLIGRTLTGAGVGNQLTYVPGSLYLAGPYNGAPLSVAAIVPAVAGPFDVGTVVVQVALNLNPSTGEVIVDGGASDPIPHILAGIPLNVRDLRVYVDRPNFTLNPTSCEPSSTRATLFGSFADVFNPADDAPIDLSARYQASSCASLAFKPKLTLQFQGGTRRDDHPALTAVLKPRSGDANVATATALLPASEFIDNDHINNPCTRVQFNANACPKSSVLGTARAFTPLLDAPLEGKVYFRSNGGARLLPDIVVDLKGQFRVTLVGFVDARDGRIRTRFLTVPDAPVRKFVLKLYGGDRGLLVNSANLCANKPRTRLTLTGKNGRRQITEPLIKTSCKTDKASQRHR